MPATYKSIDKVRYTFGGINAKTATNTQLFTTDSGRKFMPTGIFVRCTAASGITVVATASFGTNGGGGYNDIVAATALTNLTAADTMFPVPLVLPIIIPGGTQVHINVTVAATGTSQTIEATVEGYYMEA